MERHNAVSAFQRASRLALPTLMTTVCANAPAQESTGSPQAAPDATAMVGFLVIFIAMIVVYIVWIRREQAKRKKDDAAEQP